jgi:hypothetical protein
VAEFLIKFKIDIGFVEKITLEYFGVLIRRVWM